MLGDGVFEAADHCLGSTGERYEQLRHDIERLPLAAGRTVTCRRTRCANASNRGERIEVCGDAACRATTMLTLGVAARPDLLLMVKTPCPRRTPIALDAYLGAC